MPESLPVVFDTNVLIPMIIPASQSARLLLRLHQAGHRVVTSPQIIGEAREKMLTKDRLRQWLGVSDQEIERFLDRLFPLFEALCKKPRCRKKKPSLTHSARGVHTIADGMTAFQAFLSYAGTPQSEPTSENS